MNSTYIDGTIYCNVLREPVTRVEGVNFDLMRNKYFLLIAAGTSLKGTPRDSNNLFYCSVVVTVEVQRGRRAKLVSKFKNKRPKIITNL